MSIDWLTVAAQIANFLILIWLLKRFLYRPILDGIDAREKEIAERMGEAERIRTTAETAKAEFEARTGRLRAGREDMFEETRQAAEAERVSLLAEARERLAREQADHVERRAEQARRYSAELHRDGAQALLSLTRKALKDLADQDLEARIVTRASQRLVEVADELRKAGGESLEAVAVTHAPLPDETRQRLQQELAALIPDISLSFQSEPTQAPGMVLRLGGAQVEWTVDSYIDGLGALLADADLQRGRPEA